MNWLTRFRNSEDYQRSRLEIRLNQFFKISIGIRAFFGLAVLLDFVLPVKTVREEVGYVLCEANSYTDRIRRQNRFLLKNGMRSFKIIFVGGSTFFASLKDQTLIQNSCVSISGRFVEVSRTRMLGIQRFLRIPDCRNVLLFQNAGIYRHFFFVIIFFILSLPVLWVKNLKEDVFSVFGVISISCLLLSVFVFVVYHK